MAVVAQKERRRGCENWRAAFEAAVEDIRERGGIPASMLRQLYTDLRASVGDATRLHPEHTLERAVWLSERVATGREGEPNATIHRWVPPLAVAGDR